MTDPVLIALITAMAGALTAILVEMVRARRKAATVVGEVTSNGGASMKDAVDRIEVDVKEIRAEQNRQGQHIAAVEARVSDHVLLHQREG